MITVEPNAISNAVTISFSIVTLFLSMAVVLVAWQQWRVAKNKLRLDLFDRRYKLYEATVRFLRESVQDFAHIDRHLSAFNDETSNAEFLFDADVVNYLEQIRQRAQDKDALWLSDPDRITAKTKTFTPYLGFANIKYEGEIREVSKGVNRLAILLGIFGALAWWIFLAVLTKLFSNISLSGWAIIALITAVPFIIPFALVHAIAWVVRGFKQ